MKPIIAHLFVEHGIVRLIKPDGSMSFTPMEVYLDYRDRYPEEQFIEYTCLGDKFVPDVHSILE